MGHAEVGPGRVGNVLARFLGTFGRCRESGRPITFVAEVEAIGGTTRESGWLVQAVIRFQ